MKTNANLTKESESQAVGNEVQASQEGEAFQFKDNRSSKSLQRKLQSVINSTVGALQLKKDKAEYAFGDKGDPDGTTATKVITPKSGTRGLYKYKYVGGNKIDSFQGANIAKTATADKTKYSTLSAPEITTAVSSHDLGKDYGDGKLSEEQMSSGGRPLHFKHADLAHKKDRTNMYTWHHLQDKGKMELIDMNVHGAMWHYGGVAGWKASTHSADASDDDPVGD